MVNSESLNPRQVQHPMRRWVRRLRASVKAMYRPRKSIVLQLSYARSGSTLLDAYLSASAGVGSAGEVLHYWSTGGCTPGERLWPAKRHLKIMPCDAAESVVVAKVHLTHLEAHRLTVSDAIRACQPHCVILHFRDDSLSQYISQVKATETRAFRAVEMRSGDADMQVQFSAGDFQRYITRMDSLYAHAVDDLQDMSHCVISHEDVVASPRTAIEHPLSHVIPRLQLPAAPPMQRQAQRPLRDSLRNPSELDEVAFPTALSERVPALARVGWINGKSLS